MVVGHADRRPKVLFLFSGPTADVERKVARGEAPSERLYGVCELRQRGWDVSISEERFYGWSAAVIRKLRGYGINLISLATIRRIWPVDVVVMKDDFSLMTSITCWLLRRPLIYVDSMFQMPSRWWKRVGSRWSLRLADSALLYSASQLQTWRSALGSAAAKVVIVPYTIDVPFYARHRGSPKPPRADVVIAVGRDMGRDFGTLVEAVRGTGLRLRLVTLPYLLRNISGDRSHIDVSEHLTYTELFRLYDESIAAVVPLKPEVVYPSGIRAVLEGLVLGVPTVVSRVPVMEEYFPNGDELQFVEPANAEQLREAILRVKAQGEQARVEQLSRCPEIESRFRMKEFVDVLEQVIRLSMGTQSPAWAQ